MYYQYLLLWFHIVCMVRFMMAHFKEQNNIFPKIKTIHIVFFDIHDTAEICS